MFTIHSNYSNSMLLPSNTPTYTLKVLSYGTDEVPRLDITIGSVRKDKKVSLYHPEDIL